MDSITIVEFLMKQKMKYIHVIVFMAFLNTALFSCTPQSISETGKTAVKQAVTGDDGEILPPEDEDDGSK